jgi:NAD(P)-dependent dehydrogenase (short-subunit alcohol dehydrogenase family)
MKLSGKVAVITGGNSGIGLAISQEFKAQGANIVIFGRNEQTLKQAKQILGNGVLEVQGNVTELADIDRLYQVTKNEFGMIDILVANAGIAKFSQINEITESMFYELCDIHFKGAFFTVQRALPYLNAGASIILISAAGATTIGVPLTSVYNAAKAAVRSLARTLSAELVPRGIRVNVLTPGLTETPILSRDVGLSAEVRDRIASNILTRIPLKRLGTAKEMANAALFLASSDSSYCVGSEITVDGGLTEILS